MPCYGGRHVLPASICVESMRRNGRAGHQRHCAAAGRSLAHRGRAGEANRPVTSASLPAMTAWRRSVARFSPMRCTKAVTRRRRSLPARPRSRSHQRIIFAAGRWPTPRLRAAPAVRTRKRWAFSTTRPGAARAGRTRVRADGTGGRCANLHPTGIDCGGGRDPPSAGNLVKAVQAFSSSTRRAALWTPAGRACGSPQ